MLLLFWTCFKLCPSIAFEAYPSTEHKFLYVIVIRWSGLGAIFCIRAVVVTQVVTEVNVIHLPLFSPEVFLGLHFQSVSPVIEKWTASCRVDRDPGAVHLPERFTVNLMRNMSHFSLF